MSYTILRADDPAKLESAVRGHMATGWVPCGGVCYNPGDIGYAFYQAVMKLDPPPSEGTPR